MGKGAQATNNADQSKQPLRRQASRLSSRPEDMSKMESLKPEDEERLGLLSGADSSDSDMLSAKKWDDSRFIWDENELDIINAKRSNANAIPVNKRNQYQTQGIRAHPEMGPAKCLLSMFLPWHNDWLCIWIYLVFSIYFWVETGMICFHAKSTYDFTGEYDWDLMFVATFSMALTLTCTCIYLIFYPMSEQINKLMENLNYQGYIVVTFGIMCTYIGTEMAASGNYGYYIFLNTAVLIVVLILAQYMIPRWISLVIAASYIFIILMLDLGLWATRKDHKVFYVPMVLEGVCLGIGVAILWFRIPERWGWFQRSKFIEFYCNSSVIFAIFFVSFLFEVQCILYYTIRVNGGNLKDTDEWWKIRNVYT